VRRVRGGCREGEMQMKGVTLDVWTLLIGFGGVWICRDMVRVRG
jgi:hypothetical protein